jgi:hypothetical protein
VRLCAAYLRRHIIEHVSALLFRPFFMFRRNNSASCCDFVVHCRFKILKSQLKAETSAPGNPYSTHLIYVEFPANSRVIISHGSGVPAVDLFFRGLKFPY